MAATAAPDVEWDSDYCWFLSLKQALGVERFGDGRGATGTGTILGHDISGIAVATSTATMAIKPIPCKCRNPCDWRACCVLLGRSIRLGVGLDSGLAVGANIRLVSIQFGPRQEIMSPVHPKCLMQHSLLVRYRLNSLSQEGCSTPEEVEDSLGEVVKIKETGGPRELGQWGGKGVGSNSDGASVCLSVGLDFRSGVGTNVGEK
mmetsp:Transcript_26815/g.53722  ORF Transcript_26815/g.53722 Transcript_26815/m.53722 type:complete len:204 (+) Transcript_26815:105-716(+)